MDDMPSDPAESLLQHRRARDEFKKMAKAMATAEMRAFKAEHLLMQIRQVLNGEAPAEDLMSLTDEERHERADFLGEIECMACDQSQWITHLRATGRIG